MPTLNWIGKEKVVTHHYDVPYKVLNLEYSFGELLGGEAQNKIIHGDNLEALKSLLPEYEGRIKCIYIDPPYNTGNEHWAYNDNVNDPKIRKWLEKTLQTKAAGKDAAIGVDDLTRHDKWLCMMYPRLRLLQKLLSKDGVIFISIDDNEQTNLKFICDELFGHENYLGNLIWRKKEGGGQTDRYFVTEHEYICAYRKSNLFAWMDASVEKNGTDYNRSDENGRFKLIKLEKWGSSARKEDRPTMHFPITNPEGSDHLPVAPDGNSGRWRVGRSALNRLLEQGLVHWEKKNNKFIPYEKVYQKEYEEKKIKKRSIIYNLGNTADASKSLTEIFGEKDVFDTPKPYTLLEFLISHSTDKNSIILDSFAGSGTTAHAILNLNKQDAGNRKFILIEMKDYAERITAERIKRVITGYATKGATGGNFGFYTLGEPLFRDDDREVLNEAAGIENIKKYIWYSETRTHLISSNLEDNLLGVYNGTAYCCFYDPAKINVLDLDALFTIGVKAVKYIIYADSCLLSEEFMHMNNIVFKKAPRDITRF